jgi:ABC-type phosphate transport system substrate-binding protein
VGFYGALNFIMADVGICLALHGASSYPGAQFYMECAQINVTGGGSTSPATVSFPGAYSGTDPGVKINVSTAKSFTFAFSLTTIV